MAENVEATAEEYAAMVLQATADVLRGREAAAVSPDLGQEPKITVDPKPDSVNHPPHYTQGGVECIDAIEAALGPEGFAAYCRGAAIKYLWRGPHKGAEKQDYEKARWYLNRLLDEIGEA